MASTFVNDTVRLDARVLPISFDSDVRWTSSNEAVATVDANGVVTGISEGTAVITATSVATNAEGNSASAQATVTVKPLRKLDATVKAQITDKTGSHWVSISTSDLKNPVVLADAKVQLTGGGYHDGKLYGIDGDYESPCNIWMVDPEQDYLETLGAGCSVSYSFLDLAGAPSMDLEANDADGNPIIVQSFGSPFFLSQARTLVYLNDYQKGTVTVPSWDVASTYDDLSALAFLGTSRYQNSKVDKPAQDYIALCADGRLVMFEVYPTYNFGEQRVGYTLRKKLLGDVGMKFQNDTALSMTYLNDGVNNGLVVAYSDGMAELYYIDLNVKPYTIEKLGNVGTASAITAVYSDTNPEVYPGTYSSTSLPGTAEASSDDRFVSEALDAVGEQAATMVNTTALADAAVTIVWPTGSTQAISSQIEKTEDGTLTLNLIESVDVTNGLIEVKYDAEHLNFAGLNAGTAVHAVFVDGENGIVRYAYADGDSIPAGSTLAALRFTYNTMAGTFHAKLISTTIQRNSDIVVDEAPDIRTETLGKHNSIPVLVPELPLLNPVQPDSKRGFVDVSANDYYYEAVQWAVENGITTGTSSTTFSPDAACTRAQAVTFLWRAAGSPAPKDGVNPFADVRSGDYYYNAVLWAVEQGITVGTSATTFSPDATCTRAQIVTFLWRANRKPVVDYAANFSDVLSDAYYAPAVRWAVSEGITVGTGKTTFSPDSNCTRAQIVTFLYRSVKG